MTTDVNWLDFLQALASVAAPVIALLALRTWRKQDKAKKEADFIDALLETLHTYTLAMSNPIALLDLIKIGMESYAPTWESAAENDIHFKGAINYIEKNGKSDAGRLSDSLKTAHSAVSQLRSLMVKCEAFNFDTCKELQEAIVMLTRPYERIVALQRVLALQPLNWDNPKVRSCLKDMMKIEPDAINKNIGASYNSVIELCRGAYRRIYG